MSAECCQQVRTLECFFVRGNITPRFGICIQFSQVSSADPIDLVSLKSRVSASLSSSPRIANLSQERCYWYNISMDIRH
ncbi:hypothetical protein BDZ91DRAFT_734502 [Kalaharituber pfeilii]|nr:hypothetical protein BDZ91DRAFT_734502 [Kalaharituber pfeilii]